MPVLAEEDQKHDCTQCPDGVGNENKQIRFDNSVKNPAGERQKHHNRHKKRQSVCGFVCDNLLYLGGQAQSGINNGNAGGDPADHIFQTQLHWFSLKISPLQQDRRLYV